MKNEGRVKVLERLEIQESHLDFMTKVTGESLFFFFFFL